MPADNVELDAIQPADIAQLWHLLEPDLRRGYEACGYPMDAAFVRSEAQAGRKQLWAIYERDRPLPLLGAAATSQSSNKVEIESLGGRDWLRWGRTVLTEFENMAAARGLSAVRFVGRKGWQRMLRDYAPVALVFEKVLQNGRQEHRFAATGFVSLAGAEAVPPRGDESRRQPDGQSSGVQPDAGERSGDPV